MKKFLTVLIIIVILGGIGWYFYSQQSSPAVPPASSSPASGLTLAEVQNAAGNSIATSTSGSLIAFGDLNNDGAGDAAAIVNISQYSELQPMLEVFLNDTGSGNQANQAFLVATSTDFSVPSASGQPDGDNQRLATITNISIDSDTILVSGLSNPPSSTSAGTSYTIQYKLVSGILVKVGQPFSIPSQASGTSIGQGQSWTTYTDSANSFQFDYPAGDIDSYTKSADIKNIKSYLPINPAAAVVLTLPPSLYPAKTTVKDAAIVFTAAPAPDLKTCIADAEAQSGQSVTPMDISIVPPNADPANPQDSAVDFYQVPNDYGGCWAGGCAYGTMFVAYQNSLCYQIGLQAAVTDPGAVYQSTGSVQAAEAVNQTFEDQLSGLFDQIISTIEFK